ncbi:MAG: hypothetical protein SGI72_14835 [Planctomycetota bacterium]|nr:hypothetical protein [Planctomycetota bacterium]
MTIAPALFVVASAIGLLSASARAQVYERIDVNDQGQAGNAGALSAGDISDDGRFVVFVSDATNFGGPDVPGTRDVFLRDRTLHTTTRITSSPNASDPQQYRAAFISGDGSKIAFWRSTSISQTTFRSFVHVLATGITTEIVVPNFIDVRVDALDRNGRFASITARTLTDPTQQVYRLDLVNGAVVLCSSTPAGIPVGGKNSDIDDDGTHVMFESSSSQIVAGDTNGAADVFVLDIPGQVFTRASVGANGIQGNDASGQGSITGNGRYVSMWSLASNFMVGSTGSMVEVYLRDLRLETTTLIGLTSEQAPTVHSLQGRSFPSEDATSVAFMSLYSNGPADTGLSIDVFLRDLEVGALLPSSPGDAISGADSFVLGITADGRETLFFSYQQAVTTPFGPGIFVATFGPRCSTSNYCTSLPNSTGAAAFMSTQGDASRALNNLVIAGLDLPEAAIAMLVSGASAIDPGAAFGNGLLCVGGALVRHGIQVANGGVILDFQDVNSPEYAAVHPGVTRHYQIFYRDPAAGGSAFNTTDAVAVTFCW